MNNETTGSRGEIKTEEVDKIDTDFTLHVLEFFPTKDRIQDILAEFQSQPSDGPEALREMDLLKKNVSASNSGDNNGTNNAAPSGSHTIAAEGKTASFIQRFNPNEVVQTTLKDVKSKSSKTTTSKDKKENQTSREEKE